MGTTGDWAKKCKALSSKLSSSLDSCTELNEECNKLKKDNDILDKKLQQAEENYKKMEANYLEMADILKSTQATKDKLEIKLDKAVSQLEKLLQSKKNLEDELSESNAKFTDLRKVTNDKENKMNSQLELQSRKIGQLQAL